MMKNQTYESLFRMLTAFLFDGEARANTKRIEDDEDVIVSVGFVRKGIVALRFFLDRKEMIADVEEYDSDDYNKDDIMNYIISYIKEMCEKTGFEVECDTANWEECILSFTFLKK